MKTYEPYWRQRSRPCPFFSQGRCLFADSCNFLHTIPPGTYPRILIDEVYDEEVEDEALRDDFFAGPSGYEEKVAEENTWGSMSDGMNTSRSVSPEEHSARMSGLLFALRSVIGPSKEGESNGDEVMDEQRMSDPIIRITEDTFTEKVIDDEASEGGVCDLTENIGHSSNEVEKHLTVEPPSDSETPEHTGNLLDVYDNSTMDTSGLSFLSDFPTPPFCMPFHPPIDAVTSTPPPLERPGSWNGAKTRAPESPTPKNKRFSDSGYAESRTSANNTPSPFNESLLAEAFDRRSSPAFSPPQRVGAPITSVSPSIMSDRSSSPLAFSKPPSESANSSVIQSPPSKQLSKIDTLNRSRFSRIGPLHPQENVLSPSSASTERPYSNSQLQTPIEPSEAYLVPDADAETTITAVSDYDNSFSSIYSEEEGYCLPLPEKTLGESSHSGQMVAASSASTLISTRATTKPTPKSTPSGSPTLKNIITLSTSESESTVLGVVESYSHSRSLPDLQNQRIPEVSTPASRRASLSQSSTPSLSSRIAKAHQARIATKRSSFISDSSQENEANTLSTDSEFSAAERTPMPRYSRQIDNRFSLASSSSISSLPYRATSTTHDSTRSSSNYRQNTLERSNSTIPDLRSELSRKVPFGFRRSSSAGRSDSTSRSTGDRASRIKSMKLWIPPTRTDLGRPSSALSESDSRVSTPSPDLHTPLWMRPLKLTRPTHSSSSSLKISPNSDKRLSYTYTPDSSDPISSISRSSSLSSHNSISTPASSLSSLSDNRLLSPTRSSLIPEHIRSSLASPSHIPPHLASEFPHVVSAEAFLRSESPLGYNAFNDIRSPRKAKRDTRSTLGLLSPLSISMTHPFGRLPDTDTETEDDTARAKPITRQSPSSTLLRPASPLVRPITPTTSSALLFAIASDNIDQVRSVLQNGDGSPNEHVGPQSMLAFTLTNDQLHHKLDIVKVLLAYGADVPPQNEWDVEFRKLRTHETEKKEIHRRDNLDASLRYFMTRASTPHICHMSALLRDTQYHDVARIPFRVIGQDRALEELCRTLKIHSQQADPSPLVILCCGPNGHGKSFVSYQLGSLLGLPTHVVNMTTLQDSHDIWQAPSMKSNDATSHHTLANFLIENEGNRCIVILDDIDKSEDERNLWSLLTPWELGRWSDSGRRLVDVRNVIWIGTSLIAQDLIFQHYASRPDPNTIMSRGEYVELMGLVRPLISAQLGASLLSRVTAVLPFVPFTSEEKLAVALDAIHTQYPKFKTKAGQDPALDIIRFEQRDQNKHRIAAMAVSDYIPAEGARSLLRAVSSHLLDIK